MKYNLGEKIQNIVDKSEKSFDIIKGLPFNYRETIDRIYHYKNDKFVDLTDQDAIFWNVVKPYIMHFSKNIDLDTKDFRAIGKGETNYFQAWILGIKFNQWANENNLSIKIDDLTQLVSEFGSFVWKLKKNKKKQNDIFPCDLRNLYFDPSVDCIRETDIVEKHYLTESEIREKKDVWNNVEDIILKASKDEKNGEFVKYEVWEFTGYVNDGEEKKYKHIIGAGYGNSAVIAYEEDLKKEECKYYDFHLSNYSGRWLRIGAYETNFVLQKRANTIVNENAEATSIASLLLLKTQGTNITGNILKGARSGQILQSPDIQQVAIDNRAFNVLLNELDRIEAQVRKNLMLPDVATGDTLPSGTTFRGQAMMNNAYRSAFKQIRNRIAEPLKDIISEHILPSLVSEWNKEELVELTENISDLELYDEAIKTQRKLEYLKEKNTIGEPLREGELESIDADTDKQLKNVGRKIKTEKGFFNFEYGFNIDPVGETYDKAQQNDAILQAITLVAQNPSISDIPAFSQLLENNGIKSFKLEPNQKAEIMMNNNPQVQPQLTQTQETGMPVL